MKTNYRLHESKNLKEDCEETTKDRKQVSCSIWTVELMHCMNQPIVRKLSLVNHTADKFILSDEQFIFIKITLLALFAGFSTFRLCFSCSTFEEVNRKFCRFLYAEWGMTSFR